MKHLMLICFLMIFGEYSYSAPTINNVDRGGSENVSPGVIITVTGLGFGLKEQAAPILYDLTSFAYENGVKNIHQKSFIEDQQIHRPSVDPDTLWIKPSVKSPTIVGSSFIKFTKGRRHRRPGISAHYYFKGSDGFLGWPRAYGGFSTPTDNPYLYVSWWIKNSIDPVRYWRFKADSITGTFDSGASNFDLGEDIEIGVELSGRIIAIINNEFHFVINDPGSNITSTQLKGLKITGLSSGASAILATLGRETVAYYTPGANKFLRSWEEPIGSLGWRYSFTQMLTGVTDVDGRAINSQISRPILKNQWNHMEIQIDLNSKHVKSWINNKVVDDLDVSTARILTGEASPTIALIGYDGKNQIFQTTDFGEIYMDNTLQRIVIGNHAEWSKVTLSELQYPLKWNDTGIQFEVNNGNIRTLSQKYLYVFDAAGNVNSVGFPLCDICKAPPVSTELLPIPIK